MTTHEIIELLDSLIDHCSDVARLRAEFMRVDPKQAETSCDAIEKIRSQFVAVRQKLTQDLTPIRPPSVQDMRATSQAAADFWINGKRD